jgi:hypothetical protein
MNREYLGASVPDEEIQEVQYHCNLSVREFSLIVGKYINDVQ